MTATTDYAVVGAGVVGLAIARQLATTYSDAAVTVFDKEPALARHASGRNSGVIHAGLYYPPHSLKARLTRSGNVLLHEFCAEHGVAVRRAGKVVVARNQTEADLLDDLLVRARANDVPVELVDEAGLAELEPLARTVGGRALWSPTTSSADPVRVVEALAADARTKGVEIRLGDQVTAAGPGRVTTNRGGWSVGHVVNCAGLYADRIAAPFGMCDDYRILPFKGLYRSLSWPAGRLRRHVYPVPDHRLPFLGVHLTVTVDGFAKVGPTAIPILGREQYSRMTGVRVGEIGPTSGALLRFLRRPDSWRLVGSETRHYGRAALARSAAALVPAVRTADLGPTVRPGIRAQLVRRDDGALELDFVVRGDDRSTHVLNAVSPAWTSALAFADYVVRGMPG